jgi:cell division protein FtsB
MVWIGFVSDHSLWRIWCLSHENARAEQDLKRAQESVAHLESDFESPQVHRELAERMLRERTGMARPGEIVYRIRGGARTDSIGR